MVGCSTSGGCDGECTLQTEAQATPPSPPMSRNGDLFIGGVSEDDCFIQGSHLGSDPCMVVDLADSDSPSDLPAEVHSSVHHAERSSEPPPRCPHHTHSLAVPSCLHSPKSSTTSLRFIMDHPLLDAVDLDHLLLEIRDSLRQHPNTRRRCAHRRPARTAGEPISIIYHRRPPTRFQPFR